MLDFTDAADYLTLRLTGYVNGYKVDTFDEDIPSIEARGTGEISLPENYDAVLVEYILKNDIPLVKAGSVMGYDMLEINKPSVD